MTQGQLNDIWNAVLAGKPVEGWGGHKYGDLDVLTQRPPHRVWARKAAMDPWDEIPPVGSVNA